MFASQPGNMGKKIMDELRIETRQREEIIPVTRSVQDVCTSRGWGDGAVLIFCPHTTCGLTINEGADVDVRRDLMKFFREIAPAQHDWAHMEGNSDAHISASLLGPSLLVPLQGGRLRLGTWQAIYLYEGDGPRHRTLWLQLLPS